MSLAFARKKEDFICINCGFKVRGSGYTNHCPKCLYSLHVDINPGDRKENCRGLMEPVGIEIKKGGYVIIHKCLKCGIEKRNKVDRKDRSDIIVKIASGKYLVGK